MSVQTILPSITIQEQLNEQKQDQNKLNKDNLNQQDVFQYKCSILPQLGAIQEQITKELSAKSDKEKSRKQSSTIFNNKIQALQNTLANGSKSSAVPKLAVIYQRALAKVIDSQGASHLIDHNALEQIVQLIDKFTKDFIVGSQRVICQNKVVHQEHDDKPQTDDPPNSTIRTVQVGTNAEESKENQKKEVQNKHKPKVIAILWNTFVQYIENQYLAKFETQIGSIVQAALEVQHVAIEESNNYKRQAQRAAQLHPVMHKMVQDAKQCIQREKQIVQLEQEKREAAERRVSEVCQEMQLMKEEQHRFQEAIADLLPMPVKITELTRRCHEETLKVDTLQEQLEKVKQEQVQTNRTNNKKDVEIRVLQHTLQTIEVNQKSLEFRHQMDQDELDQLKQELDMYGQTQKALTQDSDWLQKTNQQLDADNKELDSQLTVVLQQKDQVEKKYQKLVIEHANATALVTNLQNQINKQSKEYKNQQGQLNLLNSKVKEYEDGNEGRIRKLEEELKSSRARIVYYRDQVTTFQKKVEELQNTIRNKEAERCALEQEQKQKVALMENQLASKIESVRLTKQQEIDKKQQEINNLLKSIREEYAKKQETIQQLQQKFQNEVDELTDESNRKDTVIEQKTQALEQSVKKQHLIREYMQKQVTEATTQLEEAQEELATQKRENNERLQQLDQTISEQQLQIEQLTQESTETNRQIKFLEEDLQEHQSDLEQKTELYEQTFTELQSQKDIVKSLQAQIDNMVAMEQELRKQINNISHAPVNNAPMHRTGRIQHEDSASAVNSQTRFKTELSEGTMSRTNRKRQTVPSNHRYKSVPHEFDLEDELSGFSMYGSMSQEDSQAFDTQTQPEPRTPRYQQPIQHTTRVTRQTRNRTEPPPIEEASRQFQEIKGVQDWFNSRIQKNDFSKTIPVSMGMELNAPEPPKDSKTPQFMTKLMKKQ